MSFESQTGFVTARKRSKKNTEQISCDVMPLKNPLLFLLLLPCITCHAAQQGSPDETPPPPREQFKAAIKKADRLTVTPPINNWDSLKPHKEVLFELQGAARIASLAQTIDLVIRGDRLVGDNKDMQANGVQTIEIEIEDLDVPCLCYGTHEIMFYSGEEVVFRLNYKHFSRIRGIGENKAFFGEYDLTKESAAAFASWFEKNGFPDFQKAIAEQEAELRAEQERARRVAAMFPENIRAIIPDYGNALQDWKRFESHKKQVMSAISAAKNRTEILHTCWRAIGDEYSTVSNPENYEPVATIFMLLAATSTEERNRTLLNAADNDVLLFRGAFTALCLRMRQDELSGSALAKVFTSVWQHGTANSRWDLGQLLEYANGREWMALRLKIAHSGQPSPEPYAPPKVMEDKKYGVTATTYHDLSLWLQVLLDLAKQRVPEARELWWKNSKTRPMVSTNLHSKSHSPATTVPQLCTKNTLTLSIGKLSRCSTCCNQTGAKPRDNRVMSMGLETSPIYTFLKKTRSHKQLIFILIQRMDSFAQAWAKKNFANARCKWLRE